MNTYEPKNGVTLIETLIVVAVIAMLASVVIAIAAHIDNKSKDKDLQNAFAVLESALHEYYAYWKNFPDPSKPPYLTHSAALYGQLQATPGSRQILQNIDDSLIKNNPMGVDMLELYDPWGTILDYRYVPGDTFPELISAGRDRMFATGDDVSSKK